MITYIDRPSPNFNERKGKPVQFVVVHYTAMATTESAIQRLCDPVAAVSSHYVVGEDGAVYRLVAEDKRAWHAGVSYWDGQVDLNTTSVGIEIANDGSTPFPQVQMDAVVALCREIIARNNIHVSYVVGHSDIAPDRKQDPGELFDWALMASRGVSVWPIPAKVDYTTAAKWSDTDVAQGLAKFGYHSTFPLDVLVTAFQRRFQQAAFKTPARVGVADLDTKALLACLLRRRAISQGRRAGQARKKRI
jgi:N-acetylmuramoyl-L-alanine amidase